jgi:hypothetical protein
MRSRMPELVRLSPGDGDRPTRFFATGVHRPHLCEARFQLARGARRQVAGRPYAAEVAVGSLRRVGIVRAWMTMPG